MAINTLKGFLAASLFTTLPVELYALSVDLQGSLSHALSGAGGGVGELAGSIISGLTDAGTLEEAALTNIFGGFGSMTNPLLLLFLLIMMGYAVIKVFFANIKRGGILLIQIAVGSLYLFSVPRGYLDGFVQWCKQVMGLCLTAFLQVTILTAGLMVLTESALLGLGLMLSAGEVRSCVAWTTWNAEYFGVPQTRRRIFLVADHAGFSPIKILFEQESVPGDSASGKRAGQALARGAEDSSDDTGWSTQEADRQHAPAVSGVPHQPGGGDH